MSEHLEVAVEESKQDNSKVEKEARQFGWVPKEEFRGNEDSWVDADVFVQRGKEINPILRKNNERLLRELEAQKQQMQELKATTEEFKKFQKEAFERKASEMESEIRTLREQKKTAIREGDGDLAVEIEDRIDYLKEQKAEEASRQKTVEITQTTTPQSLPPEVQEWVDNNSWYTSDTKLRNAADSVAASLAQEQPWLKGAAFFKALDAELEATFSPEKLGKRVKPRSPVESSTTTTSRTTSKKNGYDNLPADAKAACDKFVRQGLMTKEEYVSSYEW